MLTPRQNKAIEALKAGKVQNNSTENLRCEKGPASALWDSQTLAVVVNIVTAKLQPSVRGDWCLRYGANRTTDVGANASAKGEKLELSLFVNRYSSAGYSLGSATNNPTVAPFSNYTAQSRLC